MSLVEGRFGGQRKCSLRVARGLLATSAILALTALTGCGDGGFRPVYGSAMFGGNAVSERLATIDIAPIPGRVGQRIRNELIYQTTGGGSPNKPEYRLDIAIRESVTSMLVAENANAGTQIFGIDASYNLIRLSDKKVVASGTSYGRASFDRVSSIFANVSARQNAENRAAETVGREIQTRLLAVLSTGNV